MSHSNAAQSGFTLIEVIITIVVLAVVGMMGAMSLGSSQTKILSSLENVADLNQARSCMETVSADFSKILSESTDYGQATEDFWNELDNGTYTCSESVSAHISPQDAEDWGLPYSGTLLVVTVNVGKVRLSNVLGD